MELDGIDDVFLNHKQENHGIPLFVMRESSGSLIGFNVTYYLRGNSFRERISRVLPGSQKRRETIYGAVLY